MKLLGRPSQDIFRKETVIPLLIFLVFFGARLPYYRTSGDPVDEAWCLSNAERMWCEYKEYFPAGPRPAFWYWTVYALWHIVPDDFLAHKYTAKLLTIVSVAVVGVFAYLVAKKVYRHELACILPVALFFTSRNTFYHGITASPEYYETALIIIAFYFMLRGGILSTALSSASLGLALATREASWVLAPVFPLFILFRPYQRRSERVMCFGMLVFSLVLPAVIAPEGLRSYLGYLGSWLRDYYDPNLPKMTFPEKVQVLYSATNSPIYISAIIGATPFLVGGRSWRKWYTLLCMLLLLIPFFAVATRAEEHNIIISEPFAALVAGALGEALMDFRLSLLDGKGVRLPKPAYSRLLGMIFIISTLVLTLTTLALKTSLPGIRAGIAKLTARGTAPVPQQEILAALLSVGVGYLIIANPGPIARLLFKIEDAEQALCEPRKQVTGVAIFLISSAMVSILGAIALAVILGSWETVSILILVVLVISWLGAALYFALTKRLPIRRTLASIGIGSLPSWLLVFASANYALPGIRANLGPILMFPFLICTVINEVRVLKILRGAPHHPVSKALATRVNSLTYN